MVVRRRLLAGQADGQIEAVPVIVFDQQGMVAALRLRHGEVGQREQLRALGEGHQLELDGMQRRRIDAFRRRGRMNLFQESLARPRPPGSDIRMGSPWDFLLQTGGHELTLKARRRPSTYIIPGSPRSVPSIMRL